MKPRTSLHAFSNLGLALYAFVVASMVSCDSDSVPSASGSTTVSLTFRDDSVFRRPDSASWRFKGGQGPAKLGLSPRTAEYTATFDLPSAPGSEIVDVVCWRYGIRSYVARATGTRQLSLVQGRTEHDTLSQRIFKRQIAEYVEDSGFFGFDARGVRRTWAKMLLEGAEGSGAWPDKRPYGIDSVAALDEICVAMARAKRPFDSLLSAGTLGTDRTWWVEAIAARVASKLLSKTDSVTLFPPPPVRMLDPVSVERSLVAGGDESPVRGAFAWDSGMVVLDAEVLKAGETIKGLVDVAILQPEAASEAKWELKERVSIRARSKTPSGEYELRIVARDAKGNSASSSAKFQVADPPAGVPRLALLEPSGTDTVRLEFGKPTVHVVARVRNLSEVKAETFRIAGAKAERIDDSTWKADVALPPTGVPVIVGARVEAANGVAGTEYFVAVRAKDSEAPKLVRGTGAADAVVPFDSADAYLSWTVSDNHMVGAVKIGGVPAVAIGNTWWCRIPLAVGSNTIRVEARDSVGNLAVDTVRIARAKDQEAPRLERLPGTEDQELVGEADMSVLVNWIATDNHRVEKVEIGGEPAVHAGGSDVWFRYVVVREGDNKIVAKAWDSTGNESADSIVIKKSVNPDHPVLKALAGTRSKTLPFDSTSIELGWEVLNPKCLGTVDIAGATVPGVDGKFARRIQLPVGDTVVVVAARDTLGNLSKAWVKITRRRDTIAPVCVRGPGSGVFQDGGIRATASWVVTDNHKLSSVKIEGEEASRVGNVFGRTMDLPLDQKWIRIEAVDSCGNTTRDSVSMDAEADTLAPVIHAGVGANDRTVAVGISETVVSWTVVDDRDVTKVEIAGQPVEPVGTVYGRSVKLVSGANRIGIDAWDAAGHKSSAEVLIIKLDENGPKIEVMQGSISDTVPEGVASLDVYLKVSDPQGVKEVEIGGQVVPGTEGVYATSVPLAFGKNSIQVSAKDGDDANSGEIFEVVRRDETPPVVKAKFENPIPVGGLVAEYELEWDVADNSGTFSATIDDKPVACGAGSCKAKVPLAMGTNKFVFKATDDWGHSTASEAVIVRNDEFAPEISWVAPVDPSQPILVDDASPKTILKWNASDNVGVVSCTAGGVAVEKSTAGEWLREVDMSNRFGDSVVVVVAKDAEGNATPKSVTVRHLDLVAPVIAMVAPAPPATILGATDAAPKAVVRWKVSDNSGAVVVTANDKEISKSQAGEYLFEVDMVGRYADSVVEISAKDAAGNAAKVSVTVRHADETAPVVSMVDPASAGGVVWVKAGEKTAMVKWIATDAGGVAGCTLGGTPAVAGGSGGYSAVVDMSAKEGDSTVSIVAKDKAGNASTPIVAIVRRDTKAPVVADVVPSSSLEALPAGTTSFTVKWSASDDFAVASTTINDVEFSVSATGKYSLPIDMSGKDGDSLIRIVAKDAAGNTSDTTKLLIRRDATKPKLSLVSPSKDTTVSDATSSLSVGGTVSDNVGVASVTINGAAASVSGSTFSKTVSLSYGVNTLTISAKDAAGNDSTKVLTITRVDATKPTVVRSVGTTSMTVPYGTTSIAAGWKVADNWGVQSVSIGGTVATVSGGLYSRAVPLALGVNKIQLVALDQAGNETRDSIYVIRPSVTLGAIAAGGDFGLYLSPSGVVSKWGEMGALPALGTVKAIAASDNYGLALDASGGVKVWYSSGALQSIPVGVQSGVRFIAAGGNRAVAIMAADSSVRVWTLGSTSFLTTNIPADLKAISVAIGDDFCVAIDKDSSLRTWSTTATGTPPVATDKTIRLKSISASHTQAFGVTTSNELKIWGVHSLYNPSVAPPASMFGMMDGAAGYFHSMMRHEDGTMLGWGYDGANQARILAAAPTDVVAVSVGYRYTLAMRSNGSLYAWGDDLYGQSTVPTVP